MLTTMTEMLINARRDKYAVGAFEFWSLDSAHAVTETARVFNVPVILQVGHYERDYMLGYKNARKIAEMAAAASGIPVALHLDHAEDYDEVLRALDAGFTSVMIDGSMLPYNENAELTKKVVETAKKYSASVEAELGRLGGNEGGRDGEDAQTDPASAASFVLSTGIDALAVAIGTAHGFYKSEPKINIERLAAIEKLVSIPLVLHGGSGTPEPKIREAIQHGIAKINICTAFIDAFGRGYMEAKSTAGFTNNVPALFGAGKTKAADLVREIMLLFLGRR